MRHLLCSSTPTFRMTVSFVRTLEALCSFSRWDSAILKELWIKEVPVCTYETATLIYVLSGTRHYTHASMNDTFIPARLEDRDSCFAQHRREGSVVFCPQHSGPSCPCAQTDDSANSRASGVACLTAGGGFCCASLLTGPVVSCLVVLCWSSVLVHCLCKVFEGLSAIF